MTEPSICFSPEAEVIGSCRTCGGDRVDWRQYPLDPRHDCGGDCAACQREVERGHCDEDWREYDAANGTTEAPPRPRFLWLRLLSKPWVWQTFWRMVR